MKRIEAIIRREKVEAVRKSLFPLGVRCMTVLEANGYTKGMGHTEWYRGGEFPVHFLPKAMLVIYVTDSSVEKVCKMIADVARTGDIGDGKIFVSEVCNITRIRTGETGDLEI